MFYLAHQMGSIQYGSFYIGFGVFVVVIIIVHLLLKRRERENNEYQRGMRDTLRDYRSRFEFSKFPQILRSPKFKRQRRVMADGEDELCGNCVDV